MEKAGDMQSNATLRLLTITQGAQWGDRIADNIERYKPAGWQVHRWVAPRALPPIIDDPDDYLPGSLPQADLVVALGETAGVVQLLPDIVKLAGAQAVLVPIDRNESVPTGLVTQLRHWLDEMGVAAVFPKPFCTLTETTINRPPLVEAYHVPLVQQFARYFGQPDFEITVNADGQVDAVRVERDAACGCARYVAAGLVGHPVSEGEYEAGMLHHHYPCLASMNQDVQYKDTLMHVSGHALREDVKEQIKSHLEPTPYLRPDGRVEE
jgi:thymidylate synthase